MAKAIDWLKANYDRAVLMAAALFLFISALVIWWSAIQFGNRLVPPPKVPPKTASQPAVAVELDGAAEQVQEPTQWKSSARSGLFVPEKHFIGADGMPATLKNTQVHPPVPNEWFEEYALPIEGADALDEDPDKDGFTNLDEWRGNTDPTNAESHPDYTTKLHLISATEEPFPYIFASRTEDTFGINDIDQNEPTQFLKVGDIIRGTDFKIIKFTEKKESKRHEGGRIGAAARTPAEPCAGHPCERKSRDFAAIGGHIRLHLGRPSRIRSAQRPGVFAETAGGNQIQARRGSAGQSGHREEPKTRCADRDRLREPVKLTQRSRRTQSKISSSTD